MYVLLVVITVDPQGHLHHPYLHVYSPVSQCQANEPFAIQEFEAVPARGRVQSLPNAPNGDDHCLAHLGLRQDKVQAVTTCRTQSCVKNRWEAVRTPLWFPSSLTVLLSAGRGNPTSGI